MALLATRTFSAARGARFSDEDAQRYGEFLDASGMLDGPVDAERIVRLARPKRSPIHGYVFDINNDEAAHKYRLARARELVRHIIVIKEVEDEEVETRAYHHVKVVDKKTKKEKKGYVAEEVVWSKPELAEQVVDKAMRELVAWRDRYMQYSELAGIFDALEEFIDDWKADDEAA